MSPPITITAGLKKFTVPASTSPSIRPASRTIRIAPPWPSRGSAGAPMDVAVGHDAAADARADLDQEQMLGVGPVHPVLAAGHDVDVPVDQHGRAVEVDEPLGDGEVVPARHDRELERVLAST